MPITLQNIFPSIQIHNNNRIRLYKQLMRPVLYYGSVTWSLTQMTEHTLHVFERKIKKNIRLNTNEGALAH
jgi:hypothetical protein